MNRALLAFVLLLTACGTHTTVLRISPLDELRQRSKKHPTHPETQSLLALAEMFTDAGEPKDLLSQIDYALSLDKNNIRLAFIAGVYYHLHGQLDQALNQYLRVIKMASDSNDPEDHHLVEASAQILYDIGSSLDDYSSRVQQKLGPLLQHPGRLAAPGLYTVGQLLIDLAYRRGDLDNVTSIAQRSGCLTHFRVAGPFGPRILLGFDDNHLIEGNTLLKDEYNLGPGRGIRRTRDVMSHSCQVHLGGGPIAEGGTSYIQTNLKVSVDGEYLIRLATPNSVEVFIDGRSIHRADRRQKYTATVAYLPIKLKAGRKRVLLKVTTRHTNPVVSLAFFKLRPIDREAIRLPFDKQEIPSLISGYVTYLKALILFIRGDILAAREYLEPHSDLVRTSPLLLLQKANVLFSDPLMPSDIRSDNARKLLQAVAKRDPELWEPPLQLAKHEAENGRVIEAIARLREAVKKWPTVLAIRLALINLLNERGWYTQADSLVKKTREAFSGSCTALRYELEAEQRLGRTQKISQIADKLVACDARSNARYSALLRSRSFKEAELELNRLAVLQPNQNQYGTLLARLELAKNQGDEDSIEKIIGSLQQHFPRSETAIIENIDRLYSRGQYKKAVDVIDSAFKNEPTATLGLRRLGGVIRGKHTLSDFRVDGEKIIREFEASGREYHQPKVLVFDYMIVRIFSDGSALELIHNIFKAQSDEAVDELGEVQLPDGARLLKAQTIKKNGQVIEPDQIQGKDTISLPNLLPGDYTEFEYIRMLDPPNGFPGGFLGDRFYFKSFEVPFDKSQLIVVLPNDLPIMVDPRGDAPKVQERLQGNLRILEWSVQQSTPLTPEPLSVATQEYIPSINFGIRANWSDFISSIREVLVDRNIFDPNIRDLVGDIVGELSQDQVILKTQRLYNWVVTNIENSKDTFSQAAVMLRSRTGNRARILHYMLKMAGVESELALVRSMASDSTLSDLPDTDTYNHLLVMVKPSLKAKEQSPIWISTVDRWAPFGYIPPLLRGQKALLIRGGEHYLAKVEQNPAIQDHQKMRFNIQLKAEGSAKIDVVETLRGSFAVEWREYLESVADADLNRRFEDEYVAHLIPGATLQSLKIFGREDNEQPLQLEYSFSVSTLGRRVNGGWAIPSGILMEHLAATYARVSHRTSTELVSPAINQEIELHVHLPADTPKPKIPKKIEITGPNHAKFSSQTFWQNGRLAINRTIILPIMRIEANHYSQFKHFCRKVDLVEAAEIILRIPKPGIAVSSRLNYE